MAGEDAVLTAAHAREEVRKSLDRMQFHLERGVRGQRGWEREVRFLNALSAQSARLGQTAGAGIPIATGKDGLGDRALAALSEGNSAQVGRTKSSLLASFSDDTMLGARNWTYEGDPNAEWIWVANASACPACLARHGQRFTGAMVPTHPSCLCYPEPPDVARELGVEALSDDQLLEVMRTSNNPRWRAQYDAIQRGEITLSDAVSAAQRRSFKRFYQKTFDDFQKRAVSGTKIVKPRIPDKPKIVTPEEGVAADDALDDVLAQVVKQVEADDIANPLDLVGTWESNPLMRINYGAKKHAQTLREAVEILDDWVASSNPAFRRLIARVSRNMTNLVTRASKPTAKLGHFAYDIRATGRLQGAVTKRELWLQMRRYDDDALEAYNAAVLEHNRIFRELGEQSLAARQAGNIELADDLLRQRRNLPKLSKKGIARDATPREIADVMIHELVHAIDEATGNALRKLAQQDGILKRFRTIYRSDDPYAKAFEYGAEAGMGGGRAGETVAEVTRMYFNGTGLFTERGLAPLSATEWRKRYPDLAEWVEKNVLSLKGGDLYGG